MAKPELGTKRLCAGCGAKFYDLSKDPIVCPKCSTVFVVMATNARGRPEPVAARAPIVPEPEAAEVPETVDAEFVSLEEADEENKGGVKQPVAAEGEEDEAEVADDATDDATFLETDEDEDDDVTDIIGGDIEDEKET